MANDPVVRAEQRTQLGSRACRRLRRTGAVPGNVYGHRQEPLAISAPAEVIRAIIHSHHKVVNLQLDGTSDTAILKDVQWDTFGAEIQHFDLLRVSADERIVVTVPLELKGTAPGAMGGGMLEQHLHELTIECRAIEIPDSIPVRIGNLQLGQAIHVKELEIPPGIVVKDNPEELVVHIVHPVAEVPVSEAVEPGPTEPEVIRERKPAEEGEKK